MVEIATTTLLSMLSVYLAKFVREIPCFIPFTVTTSYVVFKFLWKIKLLTARSEVIY